MEFQITSETMQGVRVGLNPATASTTAYTWALVTAAGEHIAHGPHVFYDEKSCRSQIAAAKKSMKGAMRCKVVTL